MKKLLVASAAIFGMCFTHSFAFAQDNTIEDEIVKPKEPKDAKDLHVYGDVNIGLTQFTSTDGNTTATSDTMVNAYFRVGAKYKYFGIEGELGQGLSGIDEDGLSLDVGTQLSAFGILRLPHDNWDIFARAGYHSTDIDFTLDIFDPFTGANVSGSDELSSDGFAFGIGGTYYFTDNIGIRGDITGYNTRDFIDAALVGGSLGLTAKF